LSQAEDRALFEKWNAHRDALIEMGFLAKREMPVSNLAAGRAVKKLASRNAIEHYVSASQMFEDDGRGCMVVLIAPTNELPKWEALVREVEGESGN
jgi:hypothetical protein